MQITSRTNKTQFGHNDQKAASNISIDQFSANLKAFAQEIVSLDATPVCYHTFIFSSTSNTNSMKIDPRHIHLPPQLQQFQSGN